MSIEKFRLPVGRIVWGNPARVTQKLNQSNRQPVLKDGHPIDQWNCGVAIPKNEFMTHVWPMMQREAATAYPNQIPGDFSWKIVDGDGVDKKGNPYSKREGYAGCYVLKISTEAFAPPIWKWEGGTYRPVSVEEIETGYYVTAVVDIKVHTNNSGGLYVNPVLFELVGYGPIIKSAGVDPNSVLSGQAPQLPPGASAMPVSAAPTGVSMPMGGGMPQQSYGAPVGMPMGGGMPSAGQAMGMNRPQSPVGMPQQSYGAPSNLPPPAYDMTSGGGMPQQSYGAPVGMPQTSPQYQTPAGAPFAGGQPVSGIGQGYAAPATGYPTNMPPGMVQR